MGHCAVTKIAKLTYPAALQIKESENIAAWEAAVMSLSL
jgi:hypothetical protein